MADQLRNCFDKFQSIWQAGNNARLHLECHAGQVWIHLQLHLVQPPPPPPKLKPGPSRLRRRARRAEARAAGTAASAAPVEISAPASAEMAVQTDPIPSEAVKASVGLTPGPAVRHHPGQEVPAAQGGLQPGEQDHHFPTAYARDVFCPDRDFRTAEEAIPLHHQQLGIPQLDGAAEAPNFQCDNCSKPFRTRSQLQLHDETNQFGCDDCFLCFTTKFYADLHQLEAHPDTSYVRDHVPHSTKQHFARLHHQRPF